MTSAAVTGPMREPAMRAPMPTGERAGPRGAAPALDFAALLAALGESGIGAAAPPADERAGRASDALPAEGLPAAPAEPMPAPAAAVPAPVEPMGTIAQSMPAAAEPTNTRDDAAPAATEPGTAAAWSATPPPVAPPIAPAPMPATALPTPRLAETVSPALDVRGLLATKQAATRGNAVAPIGTPVTPSPRADGGELTMALPHAPAAEPLPPIAPPANAQPPQPTDEPPAQTPTTSPALAAVAAAAPAAPSPPTTIATIAEPLAGERFAPALAAQVSVLARDGVQQAELRLNPAEMGPIAVRIELGDGATATVHFAADVAATRDAIEAGLPELALALRESGLTLVGGGVSEHAPRQRREPGAELPPNPARGCADDAAAPPTPAPRRLRGVIDLVA